MQGYNNEFWRNTLGMWNWKNLLIKNIFPIFWEKHLKNYWISITDKFQYGLSIEEITAWADLEVVWGWNFEKSTNDGNDSGYDRTI